MSDLLDITTAPYRSVWIFAIDLPDSDIDAFSHETYDDDEARLWPLGKSLGATPYPDHDFVEVIDLEALRAYGFSNYLTEGNGLDIGDDAQMLDALTGHILLVFSQGLENGQTAFAPEAPLRLIARYNQSAETPQLETLTSDAAAGELPQGKAPKSDARVGGMVATFVLIFLFIFVGVFVWIAG
jgi:hypothetical protein